MGEVIQFVPKSNPSRDLMLITPLDVWDYNALMFETANDWLWDFCRAGFPVETQPAPIQHWSSCAVNNAPALPVGPCDCGGFNPSKILSMDEKEPA